MNKQKYIISILFVILGIQNNVMGATSLDVQIIEKSNIEIENNINNSTDENKKIILPVQDKNIVIDYKLFYSKMQYNQHLFNNKYWLMMVGNILNIMNLLDLLLIYNSRVKKIKLQIISTALIIFDSNIKILCLKIIFFIIRFIIPMITIGILLYDFNKYKEAKNSNDINQYKKYIIDDSNIDQLTKQRRYNFINSLFFINCIFVYTLKLIAAFQVFNNKQEYEYYFVTNKKSTLLSIFFYLLICILLIIYIRQLIKDNKHNIWNSIKNSIHKQDILFYIGYFIVILILLFIKKYINSYNFIIFYTKKV